MLMGKMITFHSFMGGTGKTVLSVNLATILADRGKNTCLFDLDFRSPSLQVLFREHGTEYMSVDNWLNDFLNGNCEIKETLKDLTKKYGNGKFLIGLANPTTEAIREISAKDRKWEMRALGRLLTLKDSLLRDMKVDFLFLDSSSGIQYSSINAIVSADVVLTVTTLDEADIWGTMRMVNELYDLFEKKAAIILNKVPKEFLAKEGKERLRERLLKAYNLPIIEIVPFFYDLLLTNKPHLFAREKPEHEFSKILSDLATKIESFVS